MTETLPTPRYAPAARHQDGAKSGLGRLLWRLFVTLRWWYFPLLLSDYGRMILRRKYDAIATDRGYDTTPSGKLGFVGRAIDRHVIGLPIHVALRQRLRLVVDDLKAETHRAAARSPDTIRLLSAPCGASRDVVTAATELRASSPDLLRRLELHGLDLDASDECIPLSRERAQAAGLDIRFHREDLFTSRGIEDVLVRGGRFHVVNCIGLTAWIDLPEVERLARRFRAVAAEDGALVVDNWHRHSTSHMGKHMEIHTRYHGHAGFVQAVERGGWRLDRVRRSENGVVDVYVFRAA